MTIRRKLLILLLFFSSVLCLFFSCASDAEPDDNLPVPVREVSPSSDKETSPARQETQTPTASVTPSPSPAQPTTPAATTSTRPTTEPAAVVLPTVKQKASYFEKINNDILVNVMKGSPASLRVHCYSLH